ncbi:V-type proton ATPase subunit G [Terfezia boudieri ATCC MYA-4762]|uniref:V-type proton ATPase subunit G n=1 Tax=Terfezia boudieri ATCC MYA-4762 TaxID=1051890 RepID=A0A3N4LQB5_9PEZI|nr:V-type proton ATPase subunit G [Terfezia boudieri ATCC MYA-4762]
MSAQNSAGIQTLLDAEREAQKIVAKARTYRTQRVKDARTEAQKEIENYKSQKESEFQKFQAEHSGSVQKLESQAVKDAEGALQRIMDAGVKKGAEVVQILIRGVTEVKPKPHRNLIAAKTA